MAIRFWVLPLASKDAWVIRFWVFPLASKDALAIRFFTSIRLNSISSAAGRQLKYKGETFLGETLQGLTLCDKIGTMPAKNATKLYVEDGYYHIYNRGVNKGNIFLDSRDYAVFTNYLKEYLSPKDEKAFLKQILDPRTLSKEKARLNRNMQLNNYSSEITLLAYCLMPNHFHLFIKQSTTDAIDRFMASLGARYTIYFNRSHDRVGALFQGVYKAVLIDDEGQYLHLSRYIHKQALSKGSEGEPDFPSSYPEYLGVRNTGWVHPEEILSFFSNTNPALSYQTFVSENNPIFDVPAKDLEV